MKEFKIKYQRNETAKTYFVERLNSLRYFCALGVLISHTFSILFKSTYTNKFQVCLLNIGKLSSGPAMTGFFILSGFVMYFNFGEKLIIGKFRKEIILDFFLRRIIRLYPLWVTVLILDLVLWSRSGYSTHDYFESLPYYLSMTQSWIYKTMENFSLTGAVGMGASLGWSISVEWLFYLVFPIILFTLAKIKIANYKSIFFIISLNYFLTFFIYNWAFDEKSWMYQLYPINEISQLSNWTESWGRWLVYFNPYVWLLSFICGILGARLTTNINYSNIKILRLMKFSGWAILAFLHISLTFSSEPMIAAFWPFRFGVIYTIPILIIMISNCLLELNCAHLPKIRTLSLLGDASYSLYLFHFPIVNILKDWHNNQYAISNFAMLYEISRLFIIVFAVHIIALGINKFYDLPIRGILKSKLKLQKLS